jgi:hypothetical protein
MATTLEALLNIKANVKGEGEVSALGNAIGAISTKAAATTGALKGLTGAAGMGGLSGALTTLTPLLSAAGLMTMAKGAIDAADNMNDLSMKTGVTVEALSQFQQAAGKSGTSIDAVGAAMAKLGKGMMGNTGPAVDAMRQLGISSVDAAGKIKGIDQVMLEVADKFQTMPDGAAKTTLAMQLFGKSGADMVPMLNMGSEAIKALGGTMSGEFAKNADTFNEKMVDVQAGLTRIAVELATALMPALGALTDGVIVLVNAFSSLPTPLQNLIALAGGLALVLLPLVSTFAQLALAIGGAGGLSAAFAALAGAMGAIIPFFTGLAATIAGFLTWPVLLVAALVAAGVAIFVFRDEIAEFFSSVGQMMADWVASLWEWGEPIREFWVGLWGEIGDAGQASWDFILSGWTALSGALSDGFEAVGDLFSTFIYEPIANTWEAVMETSKAAINGLLEWATEALNSIINMVNNVIRSINSINKAVGLPSFSLIPTLNVPAFAEGGFVTGPTLGMVGEAGNEYIVPERKAAAFANNYLAGARGAAAIPTSSGGGATTVQLSPVNITTGPVMAMEGSHYVKLDDLDRAVQQARHQAAGDVMRQLRTPGARYSIGLR